MLLLMLVGFKAFYLSGEGMGGRQIAESIVLLVGIHGAFLTAWVILFLSQALLVATRNQRIHMRLGWSAIPIGLGVAISGFMVAIESVRMSPDFAFFGMAYRQFLLVMFVEMAVFTLFLSLGLMVRKKHRAVHRAMMLLATLSIMAGATVRIPVLFPIYGEVGWLGLFGPILTLGAVFVVLHSVLLKSVDRWLAAGYAAMAFAFIAATEFASSDCWSGIANAVFGV